MERVEMDRLCLSLTVWDGLFWNMVGEKVGRRED